MTYNLDLHEYYKKFKQKNSVQITSDEADKKISYKFEAPPIAVWDLITDPTSRNIENSPNIWSPNIRPNGRTGIGATNHCAHGDGELSGETILDWNPFEYFTVENKAEIEKSSPLDAKITYELVPSKNNSITTLNLYFQFLDRSNRKAIDERFPLIQDGLTQIFNKNAELAKNVNSH